MIDTFDISKIPSLKNEFLFINDTEKDIDIILQTVFTVPNYLELIFNLIDYTTLEGADTVDKVNRMCQQVLAFENINNIPNVAAICVYPTFAKLVSTNLQRLSVNTACVAGGFPSGQTSLNIKLQEIKWAISEGATEIDMVISRGKLLSGNYREVWNEIVAIKKQCGNVHLKVIIESGELLSNKNIRIASDIAMYAGADFIKTSTGKIGEGATLNSVYVMLHAIKDFYEVTGKRVGMKPAGGISDIPTAINYLKLTQKILGNDWLNNSLFRFGASSLAKVVVKKLSEKWQDETIKM